LFSIDPKLSGGSLRMMEFARKHNKPHLHLCAGETGTAEALKASLRSMASKCSSIAGNGLQVKQSRELN
jgi:L-asparaginase II